LFSIALVIALTASLGFYQLASAPPAIPIADSNQALVLANPTQDNSIYTALQPTATLQPTQTEVLNTLPPASTPISEVDSTQTPTGSIPYLYYAQAGDSLQTLAVRFGVTSDEINSPDTIDQTGLIKAGQLLIIPRRLTDLTSSTHIIPDSEVVYSPSAVDFNVEDFVKQAGGYLNQYSEYLGTTGQTSGIQVIQRVATEFSVNPRLLLALLEYQSGWVYGQPTNLAETDYPMGKVDINYKGLYWQMSWVVSQLSQGYYGWRDGALTTVTFPDKSTQRLAPDLNAGSVALAYFFANMYDFERWAGALNPEDGFPALYIKMYGDPWLRSQLVEPLFPASLVQPELILPFEAGVLWSFSGGPHAAFGAAGAQAALDFAPGSTASGCYDSDAWVDASASGIVVRAANNQVVIDLDGDGYEQTGWTILYMHIAKDGMIAKGTLVQAGDHLGHPSCEGGIATGNHVHLARKFNGEWILADSAIPFVLSGWQAHAGTEEYAGTLTQGDLVITASVYGQPCSDITRPRP
jgi:LasA protease